LVGDPGIFYGDASLPLGAGLLLRRCPYALGDDSDLKFKTALGFALVLTHECDVDPDNERMFNDIVLVLPIIPLEQFCQQMEKERGVGSWGGILEKIAENVVFRVMYIPPVPQHLGHGTLGHGGILYFNTISHAPIKWFDKYSTKSLCSLSAPGQRALDYRLENHLFRPKADTQWFHRH
jgi:hypothetical protein